ncbi:MAG: H/ACA ribonucleoprotein complex subunit GAR1 [Candidatus Helarchaeota archaeon]
MKKLGNVLHISSQMNIIVKSNFAPKIGRKNLVFDKNEERIGYIYDVIGSVNRPYILIKPFNLNQDSSKFIGEPLFLKMIKKIKRRRKKGRKK